MSKKVRRATPAKRHSRSAVPTPRRSVTRREYAALAVRLGAVELQMQRNRTVIDAQGQRIAELQEQVNTLQAAQATQSFRNELPTMPALKTPAVES